jgi:hypothetical protein
MDCHELQQKKQDLIATIEKLQNRNTELEEFLVQKKEQLKDLELEEEAEKLGKQNQQNVERSTDSNSQSKEKQIRSQIQKYRRMIEILQSSDIRYENEDDGEMYSIFRHNPLMKFLI